MSSYVVRDCIYCAAVSCMMFGQTVRAAQQCMQRAVRFSVVVASTARVQVMLLCVCSACVCKTAKHVTSFPHTLRVSKAVLVFISVYWFRSSSEPKLTLSTGQRLGQSPVAFPT